MWGLDWVNSKMQFCTGYIKSSGMIPSLPSHWYVMIDGKGYGSYARSHTGLGKEHWYSNALYEDGVVIDHDHKRYLPTADPNSVEDGMSYAICLDIYIDDECYDVDKVKKYMKEAVNKELANPSDYSVLLNNCRQWITNNLNKAMEKAKKDGCYCWFFKASNNYRIKVGNLYYPLTGK